ncbi:MAG: lipoate--protein ligase family protein [Promethearchaeota archaeon]
MAEPMRSWRLLPLEVHDGPTNMAIDEAILNARVENLVPNTVRLYQWDPSTVTIGRHQSVQLEVDEGEIRERGFQLVRRISGGGAVLHAKGREITYSVVARKSDLVWRFGGKHPTIDDIYNIIMLGVQRAVESLSVVSEPGTKGCPALFVDGKKFSGNAQSIKKNVILQHGTILLRVDPDEMYSVLKPPDGVSRGRMVRSVKAKVMGIEEVLRRRVDPVEFTAHFKDAFSTVLGKSLQEGTLVEAERIQVPILVQKYKSKKWSEKYP